MKKISISKFDLGVIIAFVVIGVVGGGVCYFYLGGQLDAAQKAATDAKSDYDRLSVSQEQDIVVSPGSQKTLEANIGLLQSQLGPLIESKFQSKDNLLASVPKKDPVTWKHDLDQVIRSLTASARPHNVRLPPDFEFGFDAYLSKTPPDEQTVVLGKQEIAIEQLTTILINAPVRQILNIKRSYEEEPHTGNPSANAASASSRLNAYAVTSRSGAYTAYPFEIQFDATTDGFRKVMNDLVQSPYLFVVRSLTVENSQPNSPKLDDLDKIAGGGSAAASFITAAPGEAPPATSTNAPMFLFGGAYLHITARIDLIEWKGSVK